uniref:Uncharacterized protein n=2 Tax=Strongyloides stercoralis TaxID=6248 RepID=A0AAF5DJH4_STRER
ILTISNFFNMLFTYSIITHTAKAQVSFPTLNMAQLDTIPTSNTWISLDENQKLIVLKLRRGETIQRHNKELLQVEQTYRNMVKSLSNTFTGAIVVETASTRLISFRFNYNNFRTSFKHYVDLIDKANPSTHKKILNHLLMNNLRKRFARSLRNQKKHYFTFENFIDKCCIHLFSNHTNAECIKQNAKTENNSKYKDESSYTNTNLILMLAILNNQPWCPAKAFPVSHKHCVFLLNKRKAFDGHPVYITSHDFNNYQVIFVMNFLVPLKYSILTYKQKAYFLQPPISNLKNIVLLKQKKDFNFIFNTITRIFCYFFNWYKTLFFTSSKDDDSILKQILDNNSIKENTLLTTLSYYFLIKRDEKDKPQFQNGKIIKIFILDCRVINYLTCIVPFHRLSFQILLQQLKEFDFGYTTNLY